MTWPLTRSSCNSPSFAESRSGAGRLSVLISLPDTTTRCAGIASSIRLGSTMIRLLCETVEGRGPSSPITRFIADHHIISIATVRF